MKNFRLAIMLFLGMGIIISSCSKDEETETPEGGETVVKKCYVTNINYSDGDGSTKIDYNNNLISKVIELDSLGNSDGYAIYSYNNGVLNNTSTYQNDTLKYETKFTIENNRISESNNYSLNESTGNMDNNNYTTKYFYSTDGNVIKTESTYNSTLSSKEEFTWENGNMKESKRFYHNDTNLELNSTTTYTYDDKTNPLNNIGLDFWVEANCKNNVLKETTLNADDSSTDVDEMVYEYNSNGYPTKCTTTDSDGDIYVEEFTYICK